jgi:multidrug resistance efflux pump
MKRSFLKDFSILMIGLFILAACQAKPTDLPAAGNLTAESGLTTTNDLLVVEGRLIPQTETSLSFMINGYVGEVLAQEGDLIAADQVIARLEGREQAYATVKASELELLIAQQALQDLYDQQDALLNQAFMALNPARQAVQDAERYLDSINGDSLENEIAAAEAQLVLAENRLENATNNFEEYEDEPESDTTRATYQILLSEAQRAYDQAEMRLDDLQGDGYEFVLNQAEDALEGARTQLELVEEQYNLLSQGPKSSAVEAAESRLAAAEANLVATQKNLEQYELRAPLAGTLVEMNLKVGELVSIGLPVARLADLSQWYVETNDLTEIDVVNVEVGQAVQVTADALPQTMMNGRVVSISEIFQEARGDITYTTRIELKEAIPGLKWGMTMLVTFSQP